MSEVTVDQLRQVQQLTDVASVQNRFNIGDREWSDVVDACEAEGIAFIPWFPIGSGDLGAAGDALDDVAAAHDASRHAVAIAWLLHRSPVMVPIPGTSSVEHLEDNLSAMRSPPRSATRSGSASTGRRRPDPPTYGCRVGMIDTFRSVVRFKPIEWDPVQRRLNRSANVDDLRRIARRRLPRGSSTTSTAAPRTSAPPPQLVGVRPAWSSGPTCCAT